MTQKIGIIQINDTHANLLPTEDARYTATGFQIEKLGGYARIATKINEYRKKHGNNLLVFDNGDTFHGTYEAVNSKGEVMVPYLKQLGINAMTFHWDSAYTIPHLLKLEEKINYPILATNVYYEGTKDLVFKPTATFEVDGVTIGVIGIASNIIRSNMPKPFWEGTEFTNGIEETKKQIAALKSENVDLILVLSHLGYPQDIELIRQVDGIDIYLSGHTHNRLRQVEKFNDTYIIQSGSLATSIGYLELSLEEKTLKDVSHKFIVLDETIKEDETIISMLENDPILLESKTYLDVEVGESKIDLHRGSSFSSTMDYLLLDAMRYLTSLDIAFSNGWRYGGGIKAGKLSRRHLYQIVPMDPAIMTAELTGEEIFNMLEANLEATFSCEPFKQMGGYIKRNSGLKIYFKLENPKGQRIQRIFVKDQELDYHKTYKVAYVTRQAVPEIFGKNHQTFGKNAIEAMELFLKEKPFQRDDTESYIPV